MSPAGAGRGGSPSVGKKMGRQAPGGAVACSVAPSTGSPEPLARCLQMRTSGLRSIIVGVLARSEIAAVGRADLRHVIIVLPRSEEHTSELQSRFGISYAV